MQRRKENGLSRKKERKKDILTSFERPKWPIRPNNNIPFCNVLVGSPFVWSLMDGAKESCDSSLMISLCGCLIVHHPQLVTDEWCFLHWGQKGEIMLA